MFRKKITAYSGKEDHFDVVIEKVFIVYKAIIALHLVCLIILGLTGKLYLLSAPNPAFVAILWIVINDAFGIFACVFAAIGFSATSKFGKLFGYPLGILVIIMIAATLSFPLGMPGIIIGIGMQLSYK